MNLVPSASVSKRGSQLASRSSGPQARVAAEEASLKNPLDSLWGTIICGFVITIILYVIVKAVVPVGS